MGEPRNRSRALPDAAIAIRTIARTIGRAVSTSAFIACASAMASPAIAQQATPATLDPTGAQRSRIQPPWRLSVRADNDAFNFWRSITQRPDKEYTNGDEVEFELPTAPWWGRRFASRSAPCTGAETPGQRCLMTSFAIGQEMYTPSPGREPRVVPDWADERPYAAWLYGSAGTRVLSERSLRTVEVKLGVTGPPAFGEVAQKTAHQLTGVYSRDPVGWDTQIGFEIGAVASARESRRFVSRTASGRAVFDIVPHVGASLGNVLTDAEAGFATRVGVHLSNPWWTSEWRIRPPFELYILGGARGQAVARNITLDGNTLGAERRVDRVPLVGEYTIGVGGRYRGLVAVWRAVTRSREYETGPRAHAFSTLSAGFEMPARSP